MPSVISPARASHSTHKARREVPVIFVNMVGWYRSRVGINNIAGKCSQWSDMSGLGHHLLQATAANRPTINSSGNLVFDGAASFMRASFTLPQPVTYYLAFTQLSWANGRVIFDGVSNASQVAQNTSSPGLAANAGSGLTVSNTIALNVNAALCFVANGATSVYQACGGAASVTTSGNAGTNTTGGITLGAALASNNFSNIAVKEFIVYNVAHTADQRLKMLRYMGRIGNVGGI